MSTTYTRHHKLYGKRTLRQKLEDAWTIHQRKKMRMAEIRKRKEEAGVPESSHILLQLLVGLALLVACVFAYMQPHTFQGISGGTAGRIFAVKEIQPNGDVSKVLPESEEILEKYRNAKYRGGGRVLSQTNCAHAWAFVGDYEENLLVIYEDEDFRNVTVVTTNGETAYKVVQK